ncbi:MAG: hypothetical protein WBI40_04285 [Methylococcaceae bacterium]
MTALSYRAASLKDMQHGGQYGNTAIWDSELPIGGCIGLTSKAGDIVTIDFIRLPAGTTVSEIGFVNAPYSAGCKVDVGFRYEDISQTIPANSATPSTTAFITAQDVSIAGRGVRIIKPMHFSLNAVVQLHFSGVAGEQVKKTVGEFYLRLLGKSEGA